MARYKRLTTGYYSRRETYLRSAGFESWEIQELVYGSHYTSFRRNPLLGSQDPALYLARMVKWRRLYVGNLKRRGYTPEQIHQAILRLYERKGWLSEPSGFVGVGVRRDPFKMVRAFRKQSIESGDYRRPPKKGSHHPLKRYDVNQQRKRRQRRPPQEPTSGSTMFRGR